MSNIIRLDDIRRQRTDAKLEELFKRTDFDEVMTMTDDLLFGDDDEDEDYNDDDDIDINKYAQYIKDNEIVFKIARGDWS